MSALRDNYKQELEAILRKHAEKYIEVGIRIAKRDLRAILKEVPEAEKLTQITQYLGEDNE